MWQPPRPPPTFEESMRDREAWAKVAAANDEIMRSNVRFALWFAGSMTIGAMGAVGVIVWAGIAMMLM